MLSKYAKHRIRLFVFLMIFFSNLKAPCVMTLTVLEGEEGPGDIALTDGTLREGLEAGQYCLVDWNPWGMAGWEGGGGEGHWRVEGWARVELTSCWPELKNGRTEFSLTTLQSNLFHVKILSHGLHITPHLWNRPFREMDDVLVVHELGISFVLFVK